MFFRAVLTSVQFSSSRKVGHEHSAGCLILDENKSEIELTGHLTNVVNSISGLPTAKPKASRRHKSALQSVLISLCVSIRRKKEKKKNSPIAVRKPKLQPARQMKFLPLNQGLPFTYMLPPEHLAHSAFHSCIFLPIASFLFLVIGGKA